MKTCARCKIAKALDEFHKAGKYLQSYCKECQKARNREYNSRNSDWRWNILLKSKYGITADDYNAMLERQGGVCAICKQPQMALRNGTPCRLSVDHDHVTGAVRGLLCDPCNRALGYFHDSVEAMSRAIDYLTSHQFGTREG